MSASDRHIALLVPGLCGPVSDPAVSDYLVPRPVAADRLLSRCTVWPADGVDLESTLGHCFGLESGHDAPLAVAPLTYLSDTGEQNPDYLLRADPVHLRADQSSLRLFDSHSFSVTQEEADALVAAFNEFYVERGWRLEAPRPQRWYLSLPSDPGVSTIPIGDVVGQSVDTCLPQGDAAADWHALLNEIQMLFHEHPVNHAREQRGEPAINSLWFWGGGVLPQTLQTRADRVVTDHPFGMGLAQQAGITRVDVPENADELLAQTGGGLSLLVIDTLDGPTQYGDIDSWVAGLQQLEQYWFAPLLAAVRDGGLASLVIYPCNGHRYMTNRQQQRRFWKRSHPFEAVCTHG
ncbi:MAG: hypothetical protein ABFS22_14135 [Pseudomonadota bacterium]